MSSGLPLATININIGRGNDNPRLIVMPGDNIQHQVTELVSKYGLPQQAYDVIMQRVTQELPQALQQSPKKQGKINIKSTPKTHSHTPQSIARQHKPKQSLKENAPTSNSTQEQKSHIRKRSVSPVEKSQIPTLKKIELKPARSPIKGEKVNLKGKGSEGKNSSMRRLFGRLTRDNPRGVERISPEHINLGDLPKNVLSHLQSFFQKLGEDEFDCLTQPVFLRRVEQLGFSTRLSAYFQ